MSYAPEAHQNVFRMSDQRYRSNGLAEERITSSTSNAAAHKTQSNCTNRQPLVTESFSNNIKRCHSHSSSQEPSRSAEKVESKTPLTAIKTAEDHQQAPCKGGLESSSNIVEKRSKVTNQLKSYEDEALDKIEKITKDIEGMYKELEKVEKFEQLSEYKKFEEFFLQKNIELDNVDPKNNDHVREFRKAAVIYVQDCMFNLDQKQKMSSEL